MMTGIYRNRAGAELEVTGFRLSFGNYKTLGDTYEAVMRDQLLGDVVYVVTDKSLVECGYQRVTDE